MQHVFISYSRLDSQSINVLIEELEKSGKIQVFRDTQDILPSEQWKIRLEQLIEKSDAIVFALSPHSAASEVCAWEVDYAESLNKRIAPIVIDPVPPDDIPKPLTKYNYIFFTQDHDRATALKNLHMALTVNIGWVREHTRLAELALRWDRGGRSNSALLRGNNMQEAAQWLQEQPEEPPNPTPLHHQYIGQSRHAAVKRARYWVIGSLVVAVISGGLAILSERNRRVAVTERQRVERVLSRTTEASKDLIIKIADRYATRKNVPRELTTDILRQAQKLVSELEDIGEADSTLQLNGALALAELSDALRQNGERQEALVSAKTAVSFFRSLVAREPASQVMQDGLFLSLDRQGDIQWDIGDYAAAETSWREAFDRAETDAMKAIAFENIGTVFFQKEKHESALTQFVQALAFQSKSEPSENSIQNQRDRAVLLGKIAETQSMLEENQKAIEALQKSFAITEKLAALYPTNTGFQEDLASAHIGLADVLRTSEKHDLAFQHLQSHQAIISDLHKSDPEWRVWRQMLMVGEERMASIHYLKNQPVDAELAFSRAYDQAVALAAQDPMQRDWLANISKLAQNLTLTMLNNGKPEKALVVAKSAIKAVRASIRLGAEGNDFEADLLNNAAWYALFTKSPENALPFTEQALALSPGNLLYLPNKAHALLALGRKDEAMEIYSLPADRLLEDGRNWSYVIKSDFAAFAANGISFSGQPSLDTLFPSK